MFARKEERFLLEVLLKFSFDHNELEYKKSSQIDLCDIKFILAQARREYPGESHQILRCKF